MSLRNQPPFRADHVGSLLRPPELLKAREEHAAGRLSDGDLRAVEDNAIREIVRMQGEVGLQSVTDGEFRRASWHMDCIYQLGGVTTVKDDNPGRRRRAPARDLHTPYQRGAVAAARRHDYHHAHVPRQLPIVLGGRGRL